MLVKEHASSAKACIVEALRQAGIATGDVVLVHSDASLAMKLIAVEWWEDALSFLQDCFETVLGETGTLVVPTFYYDFCRGKPYDHERSPSQVGLFTNHIRRDPRAVRSFHAIFSFAAIGAQAHALCDSVSNSSFGSDSVFDRLFHADAKLVFFNVSFEFCTFVHYAEQQLNVDYRYLKYFTGEVRIGDRQYIDTFDFFARYVERDVETFLTPFGTDLEQRGVMRRVILDEGFILQVRCQDVYREALRALNENTYILLEHPPKPMLSGVVMHRAKSGDMGCGGGDSAERSGITEHAFRLADLVANLYPLHRTLVSEGTDEALELIGRVLPDSVIYSIETYPPTKRVWTWRVPERYVIHEAYLEVEHGERAVDFKDNPLHLVSYSVAVDKVLTWEELEPHLHYSTKRPRAIPWEFKYYERSWGFCVSKDEFDRLPRDKRYHAVIRSEFVTDPDQGLRVGVAIVHPEGGPVAQAGEMLVCAHVCHPSQANDDAAGVAVAAEVARRLSQQLLPSGSMGVCFLFCPESIGSICYLGHHEDLIPRFRGGIFVEMPGNRNTIVLQRTWQDNHLMDRVARYGLKRHVREFREGAFQDVIVNDEMVINGPGVKIPCISISRYPYEEYHTSDDNLGIVHEDMLVEAADVVEEIIRVYASNYVPRRTFRGPVFLSGYSLWVDWRVNMKLNRALEQVMLRFDGEHSIFDIAEQLGLDYWDVRDHVEKFRTRGLVEALPVSGES